MSTGLTQWLTPEDNPPLGLNSLKLEDIRDSSNYTCEAASVLGVIEAVAEVKVQCKLFNPFRDTLVINIPT